MKRKAFVAFAIIVSLTVPIAFPVTYADNVTTVEAAKKLTKAQAQKKLKKWLKKKGKWNGYAFLEFDHMAGKKYIFHYYEDLEDHTATYGWYSVHSTTGKIKSLL